MNARGRVRILAATALVGFVVSAAGGAWAAVTPSSGPVAGGTSVVIDLPPNRFVQVAHGNYHTLGLAEDGTVWAWGGNEDGQLGDGTTTDSLVPVRVQFPVGTVVTRVDGGGYSSYAVTSTGAVYSWGRNAVGELGDGSTIDRLLPVPVALPGGVVVASVHADFDQGGGALTATVFAISTTGDLYGWGRNNGKFGDGSTAASPTPVLLALPGGVAAVDAATSQFGAYVLGSDGAVYSAGSTAALGLLGRGGTAQTWAPVVTTSVPVGVTFTAVEAGRMHGLALGSDGVVYGWGSSARLGTGATSGSSALATPASMPAGVMAATIVAYNDSSYFLSSDGAVYAWGENTYGQFGDGTTNARSTPGALAVPLPAGLGVVQVSAAQLAVTVRLSDGSLVAAGRNFQGELGDGTTIQRTAFVTVLSPLVAMGVTFGGVAATAFADLGTTVGATTPAHAAGPVDVAVATQTRTGAAGPTHVEAGGFTYLAPAAPPAITSGDPAAGRVGEPYTHTVTAVGTGPIAFSLAGTLPPGLAFDAATGILSGVPTVAGDYVITITATNTVSSAPATYTLRVLPAVIGAPAPAGPHSIAGETDLAYTGMSNSAPLAALFGGALAAFGAGIWTLRSVLRKRAG